MARTAPIVIKRTYPWTDMVGDTEINFRLMTRDDGDTILNLARGLSDVDLAYLRTDITRADVVDEWIENIEAGRTVTVIAEEEGKAIGYGSLHHNELMWTSHLGELRIVVSKRFRKLGVGRRLAAEVFHIAKEMSLDRVIVQIPASQPRVRNMFEQLGFRAEAILKEWLKGRDDKTYDLLIMSHQTDDFVI